MGSGPMVAETGESFEAYVEKLAKPGKVYPFVDSLGFPMWVHIGHDGRFDHAENKRGDWLLVSIETGKRYAEMCRTGVGAVLVVEAAQ